MRFVWSFDGCQVLGEGQDGLPQDQSVREQREDAGYQNGGNVEIVFRNSSQKFGNTLYHSMFRQKAFNSFTSWMPIFGDMGRYISGHIMLQILALQATKC